MEKPRSKLDSRTAGIASSARSIPSVRAGHAPTVRGRWENGLDAVTSNGFVR